MYKYDYIKNDIFVSRRLFSYNHSFFVSMIGEAKVITVRIFQ